MTTRERFDHTVTLLSGMIIGATAVYLFDENRGAKRRAYARDKLIRAGHPTAVSACVAQYWAMR